jgi:hypothetical protein
VAASAEGVSASSEEGLADSMAHGAAGEAGAIFAGRSGSVGDCRTVFVPLKHWTEDEYRDVPAAPFVEQEIDDHLSRWEPGACAFTGQRGRRRRREVFLARAGVARE